MRKLVGYKHWSLSTAYTTHVQQTLHKVFELKCVHLTIQWGEQGSQLGWTDAYMEDASRRYLFEQVNTGSYAYRTVFGGPHSWLSEIWNRSLLQGEFEVKVGIAY